MTSKLLPKELHPRRLAQQKMLLAGELSVSGMSRLEEFLVSNTATVHVDLSFHVDEDQRSVITGQVSGELPLICQCCTDSYLYEIHSEFMLSPVGNELEANNLPEHLEAMLMEGDKIPLSTVIEDELLLNIPLLPRHPQEDCSVVLMSTEDKPLKKKNNPFSVLGQLKKS